MNCYFYGIWKLMLFVIELHHVYKGLYHRLEEKLCYTSKHILPNFVQTTTKLAAKEHNCVI